MSGEVMNGFGSFGSDGDMGGFSKRETKPVILSDSREMVPVYGEQNNPIREMSLKYPEICFQYQSQEHMMTSEFDAVESVNRQALWNEMGQYDVEPGRRKAAAAASPVFQARVSHALSPVQFYVQPKCFDDARYKMHRMINEFYSEETESMIDEQIFVGVPCVVKSKKIKEWVRCIVTTKPCTGSSIHVLDVDNGCFMFVKDLSGVKPLFSRYSKVPPLAMRCRIKGVDINDLETERLEEFDKLLEEVEYRVRIRLVTRTEPYLVHLLHSTVEDKDLGAPWLPRKIQSLTLDDAQDSEKSDYSDVEEEDKRVPFYVKTLPRMSKPPSNAEAGIPVTVSYIETARRIYLWDTRVVEHVEAFAQKIHSYYKEKTKDPSSQVSRGIPCSDLDPETACAVMDPLSEDRWVRGIVRENDESGVLIQAYDYGWILPLISKENLDSVKPLVAQFSDQTHLWECRLLEACEETPIPTETEILRQLLPQGAKCLGEFDRRRGPPWKVDIRIGQDEDFVLELFLAERERRFITRSSALMLHKNPGVKPPPVPEGFQEFVRQNTTYRKGILELTDFDG